MTARLTVWYFVQLAIETGLLVAILCGWKVFGVGCWFAFQALGYCSAKFGLRMAYVKKEG